MAAKLGRKQRPYQTSWGEIVPGLARQSNDGRWRIVATGFRFSESDERRAVDRFKALTRLEPVILPVAATDLAGAGSAVAKAEETQEIRIGVRGSQVSVTRAVPGEELWQWLRTELSTRPEYVARMVGIPELAGLRYLSLPKPSLKLSAIVDNYKAHNGSTDKAKQEALKPLERLIKHSGAKTLDDLTTDKLLAWREHIEKTVPGPATRKAYYSRVRVVIGFGKKTAMCAQQVNEALARCEVLWTSAPLPVVDPKPISREHFHKLLSTGNGTWRPWLLCGLNLCLHMEEVCALEWAHFDLNHGTYACIRNKTRAKRIPRAATLWPETIAALNGIKRTENPHVFISTHGTRYNKNTRVNDFRELRIAAGLPDSVTFDTLRDGAYTAASHGTTDGRLARLLAGHKSPGLEDNYVLRNPSMVRPACDADYRAYFG